MITQQSIDRILDSADITEIIARFVTLKKSGANHKGLCPFHDEKTPSFQVSEVKQIFKCFGCGEGGNVITFISKKQGLGFRETIEYLAQATGVELEYNEEARSIEEEQDSERKKNVLTIAAKLFRKNLQSDEIAQKYLTDRGITPDIAEEWSLGWSSMDWVALTKIILQEGMYSAAMDLGLLKYNEIKESHYDALRGRITIPIFNQIGILVGFSGRDISNVFGDDSEKPKYVNPKESSLYQKSSILFGMDRARRSIQKSGYAILVEGYTDVISMHHAGRLEAVATCGTALTPDQATLLRRFTGRVIIMRDSDNAGRDAANRDTKVLLAAGIKPLIYHLPEGMDPDDWAKTELVKEWSDDHAKDALIAWSESLYQNAGDAHKKDKALDQIAELIALIPSEGIRHEYEKQLRSSIKFKQKIFAPKLAAAVEKVEQRKEREQRRIMSQEGVPDEFKLPPELLGKVKWKDIEKDVQRYALFMHDNVCYSRRGDDPYWFKEVSNFSIRIVQHMEHEKMPKKLVEIKNKHGRRRIFDTRSEDFTSIQTFVRMVTNFGNYNWQGNPVDFQRLISKLMDEMGDGRMIEILGWQTEGFWAMNNAIMKSDEINYLDPYGCVKIGDASYYIPSANSIYADNPFKFEPQKRCVMRGDQHLETFLQKLITVHREHSMNAVLFTLASCFADIVFDRLNFFPLLFFYGPPSSGKDQLIIACQSLFGKPQDAIQMTGKANTDKGKLRTFAQFRNMMVHLSEYKTGNEDTNLLIMGLWDRKGYVRGNIDSHVGTDTVPIQCSVIFTGNYYPDYDALISRFISEEMTKTTFSDEEKSAYDDLKNALRGGISNCLANILKNRSKIEEQFSKVFRAVRDELREDLSIMDMPDRMIDNGAVLGTFYKLLESSIPFPFQYDAWKIHLKSCLANQVDKLHSSNSVNQFWECFLEAMRDKNEPLIHHREYRIDGEIITVNYNHLYNVYAQTYFRLHRKSPQSKSVMLDKLKRHACYVETVRTVRFPELNGHGVTSGHKFNLKHIHVATDILELKNLKETSRTIPEVPKQDFLGISDETLSEMPF
jgi:DNA primase